MTTANDAEAAAAMCARRYARKYHDSFAENKNLQAQVAMLRGAIECVAAYCADGDAVIELERTLSATESDWLAQHDQKTRDEAYEKAAIELDNFTDFASDYAWLVRNMKGS